MEPSKVAAKPRGLHVKIPKTEKKNDPQPNPGFRAEGLGRGA